MDLSALFCTVYPRQSSLEIFPANVVSPSWNTLGTAFMCYVGQMNYYTDKYKSNLALRSTHNARPFPHVNK